MIAETAHFDDIPGDIVLSVVIPCLNEARTIGICVTKALGAINKLGVRGEVVVSDNGSVDGSDAIARSHGARVVHCDDCGYGNTLRAGISAARGLLIVMGDADDSYDFSDLCDFIDGLRGGADLVLGNRFMGGIRAGAMPWLHQYVGNPALTFLLNLLFKTSIGDAHCGLRAFRKDAYDRLELSTTGMEFASEMIIRASLRDLKITEVPTVLYPDGRGRPPHLRTFRDGWRHLKFMLLLCPSFLFIVPGLLVSVLGFLAIPVAAILGPGTLTGRFGPIFMQSASIASICGANLLMFGFLAKVYSHSVDPVFPDPRRGPIVGWFSTDRGLLLGILFTLASLILGLPVLCHWAITSEVVSINRWISAGTLFAIGIEIILTSFLVGLFDMPRSNPYRRHPRSSPAKQAESAFRPPSGLDTACHSATEI